MSYVNLINKNVDLAFQAIKDLAIEVTLTKKNVTGFDFGSGSNTEDADTVLVTTAVVVSAVKGNPDNREATNRNKQQKNVMLKKQDVGDVTFYDTLLIAGQLWQLGQIITDDGFIVTVEVFREV
jgi:hypothetical protein